MENILKFKAFKFKFTTW